MKKQYYAVPHTVAEELHLTRCRYHNENGEYLLSAADLRFYTVGKAVKQGARLLDEQTINNFPKQNNYGNVFSN